MFLILTWWWRIELQIHTHKFRFLLLLLYPTGRIYQRMDAHHASQVVIVCYTVFRPQHQLRDSNPLWAIRNFALARRNNPKDTLPRNEERSQVPFSAEPINRWEIAIAISTTAVRSRQEEHKEAFLIGRRRSMRRHHYPRPNTTNVLYYYSYCNNAFPLLVRAGWFSRKYTVSWVPLY
jgi:hypothetical protein